MARMASQSGRIVAEIDPELKRSLHSALAKSGRTLKDWLVEHAQAEVEAGFASRARSGKGVMAPLFESGGPKPKARSRPLTMVSLFSGCGGMDLGFKGGFEFLGQRFDPLPYKILWANDVNQRASETYKENVGDHIVVGDVWEVMETMPSYADVIVGGFPCQDISINGKRRGIDGPRSGLYRALVAAVDQVRPRAFVAENVKGLLTKQYREALQTVISDFEALGYTVQYRLYQAADYGVPQTRERVFIVGLRDGENEFLPPEPVMDTRTWITAAEAIGDLELVAENLDDSHTWSRAQRSPEQGNRRMSADRPGYTIRAECHGNIQFHYKLERRISMREAARFQAFPDSFRFFAKLRETERMIGNAVPPVLAWHVAKSLAEALHD